MLGNSRNRKTEDNRHKTLYYSSQSSVEAVQEARLTKQRLFMTVCSVIVHIFNKQRKGFRSCLQSSNYSRTTMCCVTYGGSLRVSDVVDLFLSRHLQDVVYNGWKILQSQLIITRDRVTQIWSDSVDAVS